MLKEFRNIQSAFFLTLIAVLLVPVISHAVEGTRESEAKKIVINPAHAGFGTLFYVFDPTHRNMVSFSSKAPLEDIIGTSNEITGYVAFDSANGAAGGRGFLSVPVKSLNTGIPMRNDHLAGADWLDAANSPEITFSFDESKDVNLVKQTDEFQTYDAVLVGDFTLRGITKRLEIPARFTYMKESEKTRVRMQGDLIAGRAQFSVRLADFGIAGPSGMDLIGAKVAEEVEIEVSFVASDKVPNGVQIINPKQN
jgi:polyisoprenoid-binding protein YceI